MAYFEQHGLGDRIKYKGVPSSFYLYDDAYSRQFARRYLKEESLNAGLVECCDYLYTPWHCAPSRGACIIGTYLAYRSGPLTRKGERYTRKLIGLRRSKKHNLAELEWLCQRVNGEIYLVSLLIHKLVKGWTALVVRRLMARDHSQHYKRVLQALQVRLDCLSLLLKTCSSVGLAPKKQQLLILLLGGS